MLQPDPPTQFSARVRIGKCQSLRREGSIENIDGEWDRIEFSLGSDWLERILWFGPDIIVESPSDKVEEIKATLRRKI